MSARFHNGLAAATAGACARLAADRGLGTVALGGGVFQNRVLLERTAERLERAGLRVLVPIALPPNDGGISYGQAAVAAARAGAGAERHPVPLFGAGRYGGWVGWSGLGARFLVRLWLRGAVSCCTGRGGRPSPRIDMIVRRNSSAKRSTRSGRVTGTSRM